LFEIVVSAVSAVSELPSPESLIAEVLAGQKVGETGQMAYQTTRRSQFFSLSQPSHGTADSADGADDDFGILFTACIATIRLPL
jgi:hypothetical protein